MRGYVLLEWRGRWAVADVGGEGAAPLFACVEDAKAWVRRMHMGMRGDYSKPLDPAAVAREWSRFRLAEVTVPEYTDNTPIGFDDTPGEDFSDVVRVDAFLDWADHPEPVGVPRG